MANNRCSVYSNERKADKKLAEFVKGVSLKESDGLVHCYLRKSLTENIGDKLESSGKECYETAH